MKKFYYLFVLLLGFQLALAQDFYYVTKPNGELVPGTGSICSDQAGGFYRLADGILYHFGASSYQEYTLVGSENGFRSEDNLFFYSGQVYWQSGSNLVRFNPTTGAQILPLGIVQGIRGKIDEFMIYIKAGGVPVLYNLDTDLETVITGIPSPSSLSNYFFVPYSRNQLYCLDKGNKSTLYLINTSTGSALGFANQFLDVEIPVVSNEGYPLLVSDMTGSREVNVYVLDSLSISNVGPMEIPFEEFFISSHGGSVEDGQSYYNHGTAGISFQPGSVPHYFGGLISSTGTVQGPNSACRLNSKGVVCKDWNFQYDYLIVALANGHPRMQAGFGSDDFKWLSSGLGSYARNGLFVKNDNNKWASVLFTQDVEFFGKKNGDSLYSTAFDANGNFEAGPISNAPHTLSYLEKYAGHFYVSRQEVNNHIALFSNPNYQIPQSILEWPGNGNASQGEPAQLAPFNDVNSNGIYEPNLGDYPLFGGDYALFKISNDFQSNFRAQNNSTPLGIEVHELREFYFDNPDSNLRNTIVTHLTVFNRSAVDITDLQVGVFVDPDIDLQCPNPLCISPFNNYFLGDTARSATFAFEQPNNVGSEVAGVAVVLPEIQLNVHTFASGSFEFRDGRRQGMAWLDKNGNVLSPFINPIVNDTGIVRAALLSSSEDIKSFIKGPVGNVDAGQSTCINIITHYFQNSSGLTSSIIQAYAQQTDYLLNWWNNLSLDPCTQVGLSQPEVVIPATARVYPNPSTGDFWLDAPAEGRYAVVDLSGRLVATGEAIAGVNAVRLPKQAGAYVLRLEMGHTVSVHKLLVQP